MSDARHALQNLADAISPETGTQDGYIDSMDTSINRIAEALPGKLNGFLVAPSVTAEDDGKVLKVVDGDQIIDFLATLIAQKYNSYQTYSEGDLVLVHTTVQGASQASLYECLQDIDTPEEFNFSHWHMVDIATILKRIPVA